MNTKTTGVSMQKECLLVLFVYKNENDVYIFKKVFVLYKK